MSAAVDLPGRNVILIVEDEESYQDALNVGLSVEGFVVVGATNIAEARAVQAEKDAIKDERIAQLGSRVGRMEERFTRMRKWVRSQIKDPLFDVVWG